MVRKLLRNDAGQTFLELVIGVAILTVVAIVGVTTLVQHQRNMQNVETSKDVASLAQMVFDQYSSYASNHFDSLTTYDVQGKSPAEFFGQADDMGYHRKLITTQTTYSANRSTCTVRVTIASADGSNQKSAVFVRTFSDQLGVSMGATVRIRVVPACGAHTLANAIEANCPGMGGFRVSAPSMGAGAVTAYTDNDGYATLRKVLVGESVPVEVNAPLPTEYSVPYSSPMAGYLRGYWVPGFTRPVRQLTANYLITPVETVNIVMTDFKPAGRIYGEVTNLSGSPIGNLEIELSSWSVVFASGSYKMCGVDIPYCRTKTWIDTIDPLNPVARYEFANVVISTFQTRAVSVRGILGSSGTVPTTAPNFVQGYVNSIPVNVTPAPWSQTQLQMAPVALTDLSFKKLGSFRMRAVDNTSGIGMEAVRLYIYMPAMPPYRGYQNLALHTDEDGYAIFNNAIQDMVDQRTTVTATSTGSASGYTAWTCAGSCGGQEIPVEVRVRSGYTLQATIRDLNPMYPFPGGSSDRVTGIQVSAGMGGGQYSTGTVDNTGAFVMTNINPSYIPVFGLPANSNFAMGTAFRKTFSTPNHFRLEGVVTDFSTGDLVPYARMRVTGFYGQLHWSADANGQFGVDVDFPWVYSKTIYMHCDDVTGLCREMSNLPVSINSAINHPYIAGVSTFSYVTVDKTVLNVTDGSTVTGIAMKANLKSIMVQGVVSEEGAGPPVVGIQVKCSDGVITKTMTTTSGGFYGGDCPITGRSSTNPGWTNLTIDPGQTAGGYDYQGASMNLPLPAIGSPLNPTVPITGDMSVLRVNVGGT